MRFAYDMYFSCWSHYKRQINPLKNIMFVFNNKKKPNFSYFNNSKKGQK